jgi:hypothetical protein
MSEDMGAHSGGPAIPPEALQQGNQNINHPNFRITEKDDIPETAGTQFATDDDGRGKFIKPGRYPMKARQVPTTGDKRVTMKGEMTRTDH